VRSFEIKLKLKLKIYYIYIAYLQTDTGYWKDYKTRLPFRAVDQLASRAEIADCAAHRSVADAVSGITALAAETGLACETFYRRSDSVSCYGGNHDTGTEEIRHLRWKYRVIRQK
jgi:hypothetical protein